MEAHIVKLSSRSVQGVCLMAVAMLIIPSVDGIAKYLSSDHSPLFLSWARYAVASMVVLPIAFAARGRRVFPRERLAAHVLRTVFLISAMTLYFLAISRIPLATAITAFFIGPVLSVALSVVILKERMTLWKGISLALGFVGALVILQPRGSTDPGLLLAFGAGAFFAFYMIATRKASQDSDPISTLAFQCFLGAVLMLPQAIWHWSIPAADSLYLFLGLGAFSALSHILSIMAFRLSEASLLAPLVYLELVSAAIIGYLAFGNIPGAATVTGAVLIALAGLILVRRR